MREIRHGTKGEYSNHGCRCTECRRAWAEYYAGRNMIKKLAGICRSCLNPTNKGQLYCSKHARLNSEKVKQYKEKLKSGGV